MDSLVSTHIDLLKSYDMAVDQQASEVHTSTQLKASDKKFETMQLAIVKQYDVLFTSGLSLSQS